MAQYSTTEVIEAMTRKTLETTRLFAARSAVAISGTLRALIPQFSSSFKRILSARAFWLFASELAGVVLVAFGISLWSVPAALITGGLVLVAAVEVRPHVGQRFPDLPPPEAMLRQQAENAAIVINSERYGLGFVDSAALASLTPAECERVILAARAIGASKANALYARKASRLAKGK